MRKSFRPLKLSAFFAAVGAAAQFASANVTIVPTFASSITGNPNAADIETGINNAIAQVSGYLTNNVTVHITFEADENVGLGQSNTTFFFPTYTDYLNRLHNNQTLSADDNTALATLPAGPNNPSNGGNSMFVSSALYRALGNNTAIATDSVISVKTSICNLLRTGPQDPNKYDLQQVVMHEICEALGSGGAGSTIGGGPSAGTLDLYRYSASGVRSRTTDPNATAYFSINGGATNLSFFNQNGGGDYADWATTPPNAFPQVQDAFSTPGVQLNLDATELTALDVVGWNVAVPEPASLGALALTVGGACLVRRRR